jgi:hypothetical protein
MLDRRSSALSGWPVVQAQEKERAQAGSPYETARKVDTRYD